MITSRWRDSVPQSFISPCNFHLAIGRRLGLGSLCLGIAAQARQFSTPRIVETKNVNMMTLDQALSSVVAQQHAAEIGCAGFFYEKRGAHRQAGMARQQLVERLCARRSSETPIVRGRASTGRKRFLYFGNHRSSGVAQDDSSLAKGHGEQRKNYDRTRVAARRLARKLTVLRSGQSWNTYSWSWEGVDSYQIR